MLRLLRPNGPRVCLLGESMPQQESTNRFCRLLEPHHEELRRYARRVCKTSADGDDLFHEAVTRALLKIGSLRSDDSFRFWFYRVLLSVHRNRSRRGFWSRLVPLAEHNMSAPSSADPGGEERMRMALAELPAVQREALVFHELHDMNVAEIAAVQEVSTSAVKSRLARGRKHLRSVYRKKFDIGVASNSPALTSPKEIV